MPCSSHSHKPWPSRGTHTLRIEACETRCGWCKYETKAANNLRVHARRHVHNTSDTSLSLITVIFGKAGRGRVSLQSAPLARSQHDGDLEAKLDDLERKVEALASDNERLKLALQRAQTENELLRGRAMTPLRTDAVATPTYDSPPRAHIHVVEEGGIDGQSSEGTTPVMPRDHTPHADSTYSSHTRPHGASSREVEMMHGDKTVVNSWPALLGLISHSQQHKPVEALRPSITPVHSIDSIETVRALCECRRSFKNAEDLERHQKNHRSEDTHDVTRKLWSAGYVCSPLSIASGSPPTESSSEQDPATPGTGDTYDQGSHRSTPEHARDAHEDSRKRHNRPGGPSEAAGTHFDLDNPYTYFGSVSYIL
ncbi:hypothetical protein CC86DRAFT_98410 [Ophiobolus disseminans]|uniref:C2H2-type domain-containing protein n=1 Tax=Ophiobolus disseminans TaxID=1469910 RepID=A0A6A6ZML5_9PLEO|nr:hypothetical protein CC86DRAFT_98410 [Ophiobolus disseminans]